MGNSHFSVLHKNDALNLCNLWVIPTATNTSAKLCKNVQSIAEYSEIMPGSPSSSPSYSPYNVIIIYISLKSIVLIITFTSSLIYHHYIIISSPYHHIIITFNHMGKGIKEQENRGRIIQKIRRHAGRPLPRELFLIAIRFYYVCIANYIQLQFAFVLLSCFMIIVYREFPIITIM